PAVGLFVRLAGRHERHPPVRATLEQGVALDHAPHHVKVMVQGVGNDVESHDVIRGVGRRERRGHRKSPFRLHIVGAVHTACGTGSLVRGGRLHKRDLLCHQIFPVVSRQESSQDGPGLRTGSVGYLITSSKGIGSRSIPPSWRRSTSPGRVTTCSAYS